MRTAIPLASVADRWLAEFARTSRSRKVAAIDGATLLGERAWLGGFRIPDQRSAGGGCRIFGARDGAVAFNLSREDDLALLPALFEADAVPENEFGSFFAKADAAAIVERGRALGLAIAAEAEGAPPPACVSLTPPTDVPARSTPPRVLDLSALWAGPLATHLLLLAGAQVTRVDSRPRTAGQAGDMAFDRLLTDGKTSVRLDFGSRDDRAALIALIAGADIVIEAARPRGLLQLGIDADAIVATRPELVWITITAHGARGERAGWVGFGDDCGVAAGLSSALRHATGHGGFVGDAIADPLTGIRVATAAYDAWLSGRGGRIGLTLTGVAADALADARQRDAEALNNELVAWGRIAGQNFPPVPGRGSARCRR